MIRRPPNSTLTDTLSPCATLCRALAVRHRVHSGHRGVHQRHLRIRLRPERRRGAREQLGVGGNLRMDLEADHDLPLAGFALDAIIRHHTIPPVLGILIGRGGRLSLLVTVKATLLSCSSSDPFLPSALKT